MEWVMLSLADAVKDMFIHYPVSTILFFAIIIVVCTLKGYLKARKLKSEKEATRQAKIAAEQEEWEREREIWRKAKEEKKRQAIIAAEQANLAEEQLRLAKEQNKAVAYEPYVRPNEVLQKAEKPEFIITPYPVKGVFAHEDDIFHNLMEYNPLYDYTKSDMIEFCVPDYPVYKWIPKNLPVTLIPEPDNKYDPNAIRIDVAGITIGYIPKGSCLKVLEDINAGTIDNIAYEIEGGAFKLLEEDYDPIKDKSKYTLTTGKAELSAKVYIRVRAV